MGVIDWQCCSCYYKFQAHYNKCPSCGHWINWSHPHAAIKRKRLPKPTFLQTSLTKLVHIKDLFVKH